MQLLNHIYNRQHCYSKKGNLKYNWLYWGHSLFIRVIQNVAYRIFGICNFWPERKDKFIMEKLILSVVVIAVFAGTVVKIYLYIA